MKEQNLRVYDKAHMVPTFAKALAVFFFILCSLILVWSFLYESDAYILLSFSVWLISLSGLISSYVYRINLKKASLMVSGVFRKRLINYSDVKRIFIGSGFDYIRIESVYGKVRISNDISQHKMLKTFIIRDIVAVNPDIMLDGYVSDYEKYENAFQKGVE